MQQKDALPGMIANIVRTLHIFSYQLISTCGFYICNILDPEAFSSAVYKHFFTAPRLRRTFFRVPMILTKLISFGVKGDLGGGFLYSSLYNTNYTVPRWEGSEKMTYRSYRWDNSVQYNDQDENFLFSGHCKSSVEEGTFIINRLGLFIHIFFGGGRNATFKKPGAFKDLDPFCVSFFKLISLNMARRALNKPPK